MCSACSGDYEDPKYEELDAEAAFNESEGARAQAELEVEAEEPLCPTCEHLVSLHEQEYGCDYEADRGGVAWRCGCRAVIRG